MSAHLISILVLVGVFFLGTVRSVNLGVLALVGSFAVGSWVFGAKTSEVLAGFPADLFVILVGVTYLFAIAKRNGTVDWLVGGSVRAVRGRVAALPWVMFVLSGVLVALGALSPAAVAIIAPIGMAFAARYRINPLLMGLMVIHGSAAGNFSPLGVLGVITNGIVDRSDLPGSPIGIFLANLIFNIALGAVIYVAFGGLRLLRSGARCTDHTETDPADGSHEGAGGTAVAVKARAAVVTRAERSERVATVVGLAVLAIGALVFDLDIGLTAMTVAGVLAVDVAADRQGSGRGYQLGRGPADLRDRDVRRIPRVGWDSGLHRSCDRLGVLAGAGRSGAAVRRLGGVGIRVDDRHPRRADPAGGAPVGRGGVGCGCRRRGAVDLGVRRRFEPVLHQRRAGCRERTPRSGGFRLPGPDAVGVQPGAADTRDHVGDLRPSGLVTAMTQIDLTAPLSGVTVLDMTTALGEYAGRLLADLGADVLRFDVEGAADPYRRAFMNAGKQMRASQPSGTELAELLARAQVLLTSEGPAALRSRGLHPDDVTRRHNTLVHVAISPFGLTGPYADRPASDLTLMAAGGLLALGGEPDRQPVRAWGEQTALIAGVHATTAALIALHVLETESRGQVIDLSVQEAVAHSLENAAQYLDLEGVVRRRAGAGPREAGTGLFRCADGWIYLVGGLGGKPLAWSAIAEWLADGGVTDATDLNADRWQQSDWRRTAQACNRFRDLFEVFAASRSKAELFASGQKRGISIAPVATPGDLLRDPQLVARDYFRVVDVEGQRVTLPGSPYRFRTSDVRPRTGKSLI